MSPLILGATALAGAVAVVRAPQRLALSLNGATLRGGGTRWLLGGKSLAAENKVGAPAGVTIRGPPL